MIFLYTSLIVLATLIQFFIKRRVASLEKKYSRVAKEADSLVRQSNQRDGNSNRADPYVYAKRQLLLGQLAQKRDRVEAKYTRWQGIAERTAKLVIGLKRWKGKKLPYTFGVLDVAAVLTLLDYLGFREFTSPRYLVQVVSSLFNG